MIWLLLPFIAAIFGGLLAYFFIRRMQKKDWMPQWKYIYEDGKLIGFSMSIARAGIDWEVLAYCQSPMNSGYREIVDHQTYYGHLTMVTECVDELEKIIEIKWRAIGIYEIINPATISLDKNQGLVERARIHLQDARKHFQTAKETLAAQTAKS